MTRTSLIVLLVSLARTAPAISGEDAVCSAAHQSAKQHEQAGQLIEADKLLRNCARPLCGSPLWEQCAAEGIELSATIPSIVPLVTDDAGHPRVDVQVKVDGQVVSTRLDGRALLVDPGKHELAFSTESGVFATQKIEIARGQRNRQVKVSMRPATPQAQARK
jgi:hypothetical protein